MDFKPTSEQKAIIEADLSSQCVIACPGSGKTATAVRRLLELRRRLGRSHAYVVLLSYSNVAVETFRREYQRLARGIPDLSPRVLIDTVDSFIVTNIVRPHGAQTMGASQAPY
ncbi:MAG: UvrD-helicase domain-containing protein, partial [Stenotrophobium sp.]